MKEKENIEIKFIGFVIRVTEPSWKGIFIIVAVLVFLYLVYTSK